MSIIDSYARSQRLHGFADTTVEGYSYVLNTFAKTIGGTDRMGTATRDQLENYIETRMREVSVSAAAFDVRALKSFYKWLCEEGEIQVSPARRLKHPKVPEPPVDVALETDYRKLLTVCEKTTRLGRRDAAIIAVLWHTGLRRSELVSIDLDDCDINERSLRVPKTKGGKPRTVPLQAEAVQLLDRWLRTRGYEPGPLFLTRTGRRMTSNGIGQAFKSRATAAGVDVSPHSFRRALATRWLAEGGSETALQSIAGWTSTAMVRKYTRMHAEELAHDEYRRLFG